MDGSQALGVALASLAFVFAPELADACRALTDMAGCAAEHVRFVWSDVRLEHALLATPDAVTHAGARL